MSIEMTSDELAKAIHDDLTAANIREYINGIEPNAATDGEVVLWPYGKTVTSVEDARAFVGHIAYQECLINDDADLED